MKFWTTLLAMIAVFAVVFATPNQNVVHAALDCDDDDEAVWSGEGSGGSWDDEDNWEDEEVPDSDDDVCIPNVGGPTVKHDSGFHIVKSIRSDKKFEVSGGALTVNNDSEFNDEFILSGGTVTGAGDFEIKKKFKWTKSSSMRGSGTTIVNGGMEFTMPSFDTATLGRDLEIPTGKKANWKNGNITLAIFSSAIITNNGTFEVTHNQARSMRGFSGSSFVNNGTFKKKSHNGMTTIDTPFIDSSPVEVTDGTLRFSDGGSSSGNFDIAAGSAVEFSGGTFTLNQNASFTGDGVVSVIGGTLAIAGTNVTADNLEIKSGTLNGAGQISANDTLSISGSSGKTLDGITLVNNGTGEWTAGSIVLKANTTFLNSSTGTFDVQGNVTFDRSGSALATLFDNDGTFTRSSGSGTTTIETPFVSSNTVDVSTGILRFTGGGSSDSNMNVDAGAEINIGDGTFVLQNSASITGLGFTSLKSGTVTIEGSNIAAGNFEVAAGTLNGSGNLAISDELKLSGGTQSGGGTTTVALGADLTLEGSGKTLDGRNLINHGTAVWTSGSIVLKEGTTFQNTGSFNIQDNLTFDRFGTDNNTLFDNDGTVTKSDDTGTAKIETPFDNSGEVSSSIGILNLTGGGTSSGDFSASAPGTLQFGGGTHDLDENSTVTGDGTIKFTSGTTNIHPDATYNVTGTTEISGGTANINGSTTAILQVSNGVLGGTGDFSVTDLFEWTGGTVGGGGSLIVEADPDVDADLVISSGTTKTLDTKMLNNNATGVWSAGTITVKANSVFNNSSTGTLEITGNLTFDRFGSDTGTLFNNEGAVTKSSGTGTSQFQTPFDNSGSVSSSSGILSLDGGGTSGGDFSASAPGTLRFGGGTHDLDENTSVTGDGTIGFSGGITNIHADATYDVSGTTSVSGGIANINGSTTAVLEVSGGELGGTGNLSVTDLFEWTGGTLSGVGGSVTVEADPDIEDDLSIFNGATKTLDGKTLNNNSTAAWTGGQVTLKANTTFNNNGSFDIQGNRTFDRFSTDEGTLFNNVGLLTRSTGDGSAIIETPFVNNSPVEISTGVLSLRGGGSSSGNIDIASGASINFEAGTNGDFALDEGADFTGLGFARVVSGNVFVNGSAVAAENFEISGGTLSGSGHLIVSDELKLTGGSQTGTGSTNVDGSATLTISGGSNKTLDIRTFNNNGTGVWDGGTIILKANTTFNNTGSFDLQGNHTLDRFSTDLGTLFNNEGTFTKSSGDNTSIFEVPFVNTGDATISSGVLRFTGNDYVQTDGTTTIDGATLQVDSSKIVDINGGLLQGGNGGTVDGDVVISGTGVMGPGLSPGILAIIGNYTNESTGTYFVEIDGPTAGDDHDQTTVSGPTTSDGAITLDGMLEVDTGFEPQVGSSFVIMTYKERSGEFSDFDADIDGTKFYDIIYDDSNGQVLLLVTVEATADLVISKEVNRTEPIEGSTVEYTVTVGNNGPDSTTGVTVKDAIPEGLEIVGVSVVSQGTYNETTGIWDVGGLSVGTDATLNVRAIVKIGTAGQSIVNTATVTASSLPDLITDDNSSSATVEIPGLDFGDAPSPFPTLLIHDGARHTIVDGMSLGPIVDGELDGEPHPALIGDDFTGLFDEDGVLITSAFAPGEPAEVTVFASTSGMLDAWIDYNSDGDWDDAREHIFASEALTAGPNVLFFPVPHDATPSAFTASRWRFSTAGGLSLTGPADDGEVEDHLIVILALDYGDAPDTYPTLLIDDGARHLILPSRTVILGSLIDHELDGIPDAFALGDNASGIDDEDGVVFTTSFVAGLTTDVDITVTGTGLLDAWVDFNADGDFDDSDEQIFDSFPVVSGTNSLSFGVPIGAPESVTFARFRVSSLGDLSPAGIAGDGEVEDYHVEILAAPVPNIEITKLPELQQVVEGGTALFEVTITNNGEVDLTDVSVFDALSSDCNEQIGELLSGNTFTYECSEDDVTSSFTNLISVSGFHIFGFDPVIDTAEADVEMVHPAIEITKSPNSQLAVVGDVATFEISVANTGDVDLTLVEVTDDLAPLCDSVIGFLPIGDSESYSCDSPVVTEDITNIAIVSAEPLLIRPIFEIDPASETVFDSDSAFVDAINPSIEITKSPDSQQIVSGETATFEIFVTNTGDIALEGVSVEDSTSPNCDNLTIGALEPGEAFSYTCFDTGASSDFVNSAIASGTPPVGEDVTDSDTAAVQVVNPSISIEKTPGSQDVVSGGTVAFGIIVTNTGDIDLIDVTVTDPLAPDCDNFFGSIPAGESESYTCFVENVIEGFVNVISVGATAELENNDSVIVEDSDSAVVEILEPRISIEKTPDSQTILSGETAQFNIVVTNTGDATLSAVTVIDALAPNCDTAIGELAAGESHAYECSLDDVTEDFTNTAVVSASTGGEVLPTNNNGFVTDSDDAKVDVINPGIEIVKSPASQDVPFGEDATFEITIINTGDVDLTNVSLSDASASDCNLSLGSLVAGDDYTYDCALENVTESLTNRAIVTATHPLGGEVSDDDTANVVVIPVVDLDIVKTADKTEVLAGEEITYTIVVTNLGPSIATGLEVSDDLFGDIEVFSVSATNGTASNDTVGSSWDVGSLGVDESATLTIVVDVLSSANSGDILINEAVASANEYDPNLDNNIDFAETVVISQADLSINKTDSVDPVISGNSLTYTIEVSNNGPDTAQNVVVTDTLPAGVTLVSTSGCAEDPNGAPTCSLGDIAAGASALFTITVDVDSDTVGTITNSAFVSSDTLDPESANNSTSQDTRVDQPEPDSADLSINKTDSVDPVISGNSLTYTIEVSNNGPDTAQNVVVTDTLPAGVTLVSTSGCAEDPNGAPTCSLGDIAAGAFALFTITVDVNSDTVGTITNSASVSSDTLEPESANNSTSENTTVNQPEPDSADLSINKTDSVDPVISGNSLTYTLEVSNNGPDTAQNVVVTDTLPAGVTLVSTSGCAEDPNGAPTCSLGNIAAGAFALFTITVDVNSDTVGTITNSASVSSDTLEPESANNSTSENTTVNQPEPDSADLSINKTDSVDPVISGNSLTYTLEVSNNGPDTAQNVVVTDTLPAGVTLVSTSGCAEDPNGAPTCSLGNIAAGASALFTITVDVNSTTTGTITNPAFVSSDTLDPESANNSTSENTTVNQPEPDSADLSISKTDDIDPIIAGNSLTYTITVTNNGPDTAQNVVVTDTLPAGVTLVSTSGCAEDPNGAPTCSLGDIAAGAFALFTITVDVNSDTVGTITNSASVSSDTLDPESANNSTSQDTRVDQPQPPSEGDVDLSVTKSADKQIVALGNQVTYTVLVTNNSSNTATGIVLEDDLPPGLTVDSMTSDCDISDDTVRCELGSLGTGESVEITIVGTVGSHEAVINFEGLDEGLIVDSVALGRGIVDENIGGTVSVFGDSKRGISSNAAIIFDASCDGGCSGGENDLFAPELGNVLIMAKDIVDEDGDGLVDDPDGDSRPDAPFTFDFRELGLGKVTVISMDVLDVEERSSTGDVDLFGDGDLLENLNVPVVGDNGRGTLPIGVAGVDKMRVTLSGSGALDNIVMLVANTSIENRVFVTSNEEDVNPANNEASVVTVVSFEVVEPPLPPTPKPDPAFDILVSLSPDRSGAVSLDGETVEGEIFVFTDTDESVDQVRFFVDGVFFDDENVTPHDLVGSGVPFDTTGLINGPHSITAEIDFEGDTFIVIADFEVDNAVEPPPLPEPDPVFDILVSLSPDRSGAISLDGETVEGDIFVFTDTDESVDQVRFFIDGVFFDDENVTPHDLVGSGVPFDTTGLINGLHSITAEIDFEGDTFIVVADFEVDNAVEPPPLPEPDPVFDILVSLSPDRSGAVSLDGETVRGEIFVFTDTDDSVDSVSFYINGNFVNDEGVSPHDLAGTAPGTPGARPAHPFDTFGLPNGLHSVRAEVDTGDSVVVVEADFIVDNATEPPSPSDPEFELLVSLFDDRSDSESLDGASVAGNIYVFTSDNENTDRVSFFIDGDFARTESVAPFDLAGTLPGVGLNRLARAFDTTELDNGLHEARVVITTLGGDTIELVADFAVDNTTDSGFDVLVSSSPNRSGAVSLDGETVFGDIYVFTGPDDRVRTVSFTIDGSHVRTESRAPFDLAGTASGGGGSARPAFAFDSEDLSNGSHTIVVEIDRIGSDPDVVLEAEFDVLN